MSDTVLLALIVASGTAFAALIAAVASAVVAYFGLQQSKIISAKTDAIQGDTKEIKVTTDGHMTALKQELKATQQELKDFKEASATKQQLSDLQTMVKLLVEKNAPSSLAVETKEAVTQMANDIHGTIIETHDDVKEIKKEVVKDAKG